MTITSKLEAEKERLKQELYNIVLEMADTSRKREKKVEDKLNERFIGATNKLKGIEFTDNLWKTAIKEQVDGCEVLVPDRKVIFKTQMFQIDPQTIYKECKDIKDPNHKCEGCKALLEFGGMI